MYQSLLFHLCLKKNLLHDLGGWPLYNLLIRNKYQWICIICINKKYPVDINNTISITVVINNIILITFLMIQK